jgi:integration host factor subunit alpha
MTLTKADLADSLFNKLGLGKRDAKKMVDLLFQELCLALGQGEEIRLSGFGNFELRDKSERPGRNPKTGEVIPVEARRVVVFHAGQKLKAITEDYQSDVVD